MGKIYVIQASTDKGKTWINLMCEGSILCHDIKIVAKNRMEEIYQHFRKEFKRLNVKPIARRWYRIKEYVEVQE